jgi:hypothetical protein
VLLSGEGLAALDSDERLLDLEFVDPSVLADLRAIAGVRAVCVLDEPIGSGTAVRVEVQGNHQVAEDIIRVCQETHGMELFGFLPPGACRPDFSRPAVLTPLPPLRGILETARYLANRAALEDRLGTGYPKLLDCMAQRLGKVRFFALQPGPLEATSRLLQRSVLER